MFLLYVSVFVFTCQSAETLYATLYMEIKAWIFELTYHLAWSSVFLGFSFFSVLVVTIVYVHISVSITGSISCSTSSLDTGALWIPETSLVLTWFKPFKLKPESFQDKCLQHWAISTSQEMISRISILELLTDLRSVSYNLSLNTLILSFRDIYMTRSFEWELIHWSEKPNSVGGTGSQSGCSTVVLPSTHNRHGQHL